MGCKTLACQCRATDRNGAANQDGDRGGLHLVEHHGLECLHCHGRHWSSGHRGHRLSCRYTHCGLDRHLHPGGRHRGPCRLGAESAGLEARRKRDSAAYEPGSKPLLPPGQPALYSADRPTELLRGHLASQPFEVAEDDWLAELLRKPIELLMHLETGTVFARGSIVRVAHPHRASPPLMRPPPGGGRPRLGRSMECDPVEPARERATAPDRPRPLGEGQENRLRCILGIVRVAQNLTAHAVDHRPMTLDQRRESVVVALRDEELQQVAIRHGPYLSPR